jgi:ribosomal protein L11 methyltransferase
LDESGTPLRPVTPADASNARRLYSALDLRFPAGFPDLPDLVSAALDDLAPSAVHETGTDDRPVWRIFFPSSESRDRASATLQAAFAADGLEVAAIEVPDEDWAARSQRDLRAVRVGRLIVAPPWDVPATAGGDEAPIVIVIQPSTGFGTGHHETTRLCLELLQDIDCRGMRVIDAGTGSGILALAAGALGAREVDAIDDDPDAIRNARENLDANASLFAGEGGQRVRPAVADLRDPRAPADLVLANLTGGLLRASAPCLAALARPGGRLLLSGFQSHEADAVMRAFAVARVVRRRCEGTWEAAVLRLTIDD